MKTYFIEISLRTGRDTRVEVFSLQKLPYRLAWGLFKLLKATLNSTHLTYVELMQSRQVDKENFSPYV